MRFLSTLVASTIGSLIALGLIFFIFIGFIFVAASAGEPAPQVRAGSVLHLDLSGPLYDAPPELPFASLSGDPVLTVRGVVRALEKAAADDRIEAVWLQPIGVGAGWASMEEVRNALVAFKASGKSLIASSGPDGFTEADYFLASAADEIYAVPEGSFELNGFFFAVQFYTEALAKLDIEPEVIRAGRFKAAVEPFTRTDLSEDNAEQLRSLIETQERVFFDAVSTSRDLPRETLNELTDSGAVYTAAEAEQAGLLDDLLYEDQVEDLLREATNTDADDSLRRVAVATYARVSPSEAGLEVGNEGTIALVYAEGGIVTGESSRGGGFSGATLGSETLNRQIRRLRDRDDIDAIVLRIDSPGGSATASEAMWRELTLAAAEKPLIASMGELAASGGYYIAAPADTIVAEPTTITGSIGVFALLVSANGFFENKLGITSDAVLTSPYADMFSGLRPLSDAEEAVIARGIDRTYETFINRVAEGRGLSTDSVLAIAEGRVWSGSDAQAVRLVDVLGGIDVALDLAAERAGLAADAYRVEVFPKERPLFEQLEDAFQVKISERFQSPAERTLMRSLRRLNQIAESHGSIQMRMEFDVEVR